MGQVDVTWRDGPSDNLFIKIFNKNYMYMYKIILLFCHTAWFLDNILLQWQGTSRHLHFIHRDSNKSPSLKIFGDTSNKKILDVMHVRVRSEGQLKSSKALLPCNAICAHNYKKGAFFNIFSFNSTRTSIDAGGKEGSEMLQWFSLLINEIIPARPYFN